MPISNPTIPQNIPCPGQVHSAIRNAISITRSRYRLTAPHSSRRRRPITSSLNLPLDIVLPGADSKIAQAQAMVFQALGDTGGVKGTETQEGVAAVMVRQIEVSRANSQHAEEPLFLYQLGAGTGGYTDSERAMHRIAKDLPTGGKIAAYNDAHPAFLRLKVTKTTITCEYYTIDLQDISQGVSDSFTVPLRYGAKQPHRSRRSSQS